MTSLILGGNGFIGSHLADCLIEQGEHVRIFDRGADFFRKPLQGVEYFSGEFSDSELLTRALSEVDTVYHLISTTVPSTSNQDPVFDIGSNLINTVKLLDLMKDLSVPKIVYLSSGGTVYGVPDYSPIKETHALKPISSYGIVKVAIENYLHMYHHLYGLQYVVLRASNPYGPRQGHAGVQGVVGTFVNRAYNGQSLEIWGNGEVVRDYIFIDDLISLCLKAGASDASGVYNAGSGAGHSVLDVVEYIQTVANADIEVVFKNARAYDVPHAVLDVEKAISTFSWKPVQELSSGVSQVWEWLRLQDR